MSLNRNGCFRNVLVHNKVLHPNLTANLIPSVNQKITSMNTTFMKQEFTAVYNIIALHFTILFRYIQPLKG